MRKAYAEPELELVKLHFGRMMEGGDPGEGGGYIRLSEPQVPTRVVDDGE